MVSFPVLWQPCSSSGWDVVQVKYMFNISLGKMLQPKPNGSNDRFVPYIKAVNVHWDGVSLDALPSMWASPDEVNNLELVTGDLLVCEGGEVGRASILDSLPPKNCIFQNALHRVRSKKNDVRYLKYCLKQASEAGWFDVICNKATIAHFTVEKFRELLIHIPSFRLQQAIANYLDRETAHIDALIAEKERMLALLEEKRAALISQAVTRGLTNSPGANLNAGASDGGPQGDGRDSPNSPDAPLKPSGLDWLGDIPAHWDVCQQKRVWESNDYGISVSIREDGDIKVLPDYHRASAKVRRRSGIGGVLTAI